ncbi:MAG TPA: phage holin family protein [Candidatus Limnocylindria bacterium]|nr:phage holin family protein [Candidatus Limnocylindria bacterium]
MAQDNRIGSPRPSVTATIIGAAADAKELLTAELKLTKLEFQREVTKAKSAAVTVAIGAGFGFLGAISLVFMLVHLLATFTMLPLWGCFGIVGGALALFGALLATSGRIKSKEINVLPRLPMGLRKDIAP